MHIQQKEIVGGVHIANDSKILSLGEWNMDGTSLHEAVIAYIGTGGSHMVSSLLYLINPLNIHKSHL